MPTEDKRHATSSSGRGMILAALPCRIFAILLAIIAIPLLWWGGELVTLGGSTYYLLTGIALGISAILLLCRRAAGAWLYAAILALTIAWGLWEAGPRFWPLVPRLGGPLVLGLILALPILWKPLKGWPRGRLRVRQGIGVIALGAVGSVLAGLGLHALSDPLPEQPIYRKGMTSAPAMTLADVDGSGDWKNYGNDPGGSRFSALTQINTANVGDLDVAWTFRVGPDAKGNLPMMEVNPLKIGDSVYVCTAYGDMISLDAETGKQNWRYQSGRDMSWVANGQCRGLGYFKTSGLQQCNERLFINILDARLVAVDAHTGRPCTDFGQNGSVNLLDGIGDWPRDYYFATSGPTVVRGNVVTNSWVRDGQTVDGPSGVIRAFDAITGKLAWAFDVGDESRTGPPPPGQTYTRGTPNAWPPMSADEELGMVYVPFGNTGPDFISTHRKPYAEKINDAVVALDAETGRMRWHFQTTHRDVWDMDLPSQPTLADVRIKGVMRKALIQPTKRGEFFVLDRVTGEPLHKVEELPTPQQGKVPEEQLSPTQPFSTGMPSARAPEPTERTMWGISPIDQLWCRVRFHKMQYFGPLTPFGTSPTLMNPGAVGASSWGSVAIDKDRGLMVMNTMRLMGWGQLITREQADRIGLKLGLSTVSGKLKEGFEIGHEAGAFPQQGVPYGAFYAAVFQSPLEVPCTEPPFGMMNAVDLNTGKLVWSKPFGLADKSGPWGLKSFLPLTIGSPNTGGTITTRGGVSFVGASQDGRFRAFETATGKQLWSHNLPAGAMSTPSTYYSEKSGRQFVVVAAAGHAYIKSPPGDYIVAFALPEKRGSPAR